MRRDETTSEKRSDISADELLKLLHKSVEKPSDGSAAAENYKSKPLSAGAAKKRSAPLQIDDAVYKSAEQELKNSDAATAKDDSDLDIDALIAKYIHKPEPAPEVQEEPIEEIVREFSSSHRPKVIEETSVSKPELIPESTPDEELYSEPTDDIEPIDEMMTESVSELPIEEDEDVKVFGDEIEPMAEAPVYEDAADLAEIENTEKTAVFDISEVKAMVDGNGETEVDRIIDEAFENSATEVFTPVNESDLADEQYGAPESDEQIYGTPDGEEIDQTDLNLMIAFGMNDELKDTVGEEKAIAIEDEIHKKHEETSQMQAISNKIEFTSRDQVNEILTSYKSQYYTLILRIILSVVLVGAVFLLENYSMFGITLPTFMRPTSYPIVFAMIDLQLIALCGALVYRQVIDGVKDIVALKPVPESITAFMLAMSVIYTFVAALTAPVEGFKLYNLPVAFAVVLALIYEFMNLKRDVFSFNVVSSKKKKFVVSPVSDSTESLEREMFRDYIPADSQIIRVGKTDFVDGFFARVSDSKISKPIIGIIIPIVIILAAIFVIITYLKTQSVYEAFTMAFMTITLTMPLSAFIIYSFPFYRAAKDSYDNDSAIIGETSLHEYAGSAVISFEDKEVFPSGGVKVTSIKVYGNNRIDEIIYSLASAFIKVGGPLADVFSQATHDLGHSEDVELLEVDDDGFSVTIDDVEVYIGKASYMEKKDYDPPFDAEDKKIEQSTSVGILYVAYSGQLTAKVYVQYTIDSEFEGILSQLYKTGMCVGIKSFDPNIDDLMLAKKIKAMKYPVKVIRSKTVEDIPHTFERCDSGIVSKRSVKTLLKTVALCERVGAVIKTNMIFKILAMLIGIIAMVFIFSFGSELEIRSLWIMLYQLFWVIPVLIISFFTI